MPKSTGDLGKWLKERLETERLSLRQAAAKTGLSHATIAGIISGVSASPETIRKLAHAFGGDGKQGLIVEDQLLVLGGYRTPRPDGEEITEPMAQLLDQVQLLTEPELKILIRFVDFLTELKKGNEAKEAEPS